MSGVSEENTSIEISGIKVRFSNEKGPNWLPGLYTSYIFLTLALAFLYTKKLLQSPITSLKNYTTNLKSTCTYVFLYYWFLEKQQLWCSFKVNLSWKSGNSQYNR